MSSPSFSQLVIFSHFLSQLECTGSAVAFGSMDDITAPISSSLTAVPPTKSKGMKIFGSVPVATPTGHVNGNHPYTQEHL